MDLLNIEDLFEISEDGRWDDESFVNEQAELSAAQDASDEGIEMG